jgi:hypothetical protein
MTLLVALAAAAALASTPAQPTQSTLLVGRTAYDGSLDGTWNGWTNTAQHLLEDGHVIQVFQSGTRQLVTLERGAPGGGRVRTVVAAVGFEVPKAHQLSELGYCEVKGKVTPLAFAVVPDAGKDDEYHPRPRAAWLLDVQSERIVALDPATVRCGNAAIGL